MDEKPRSTVVQRLQGTAGDLGGCAINVPCGTVTVLLEVPADLIGALREEAAAAGIGLADFMLSRLVRESA